MNKSTWESTVKPVVVLSVIALVVSFLLALVNSFTAPIIEENQKAATLAAYVDVMPTVSDAKTLEEVTDYTTENVTGVVKAEDGSIAIKAEEKGFDGGILSVIIGFDTNGTVTYVQPDCEKVEKPEQTLQDGTWYGRDAEKTTVVKITVVNGEITIGPWQNLTLVECDTRNRVRDIVFQVMGE